MAGLPTLRKELVTALAVVFAGALFVFVMGVMFVVPRDPPARDAAVYYTLLVAADVGLFALFGRFLVERRVIVPMERLVAQIEAIAAGNSSRLESAETAELERLGAAVNHMTDRLVHEQQELAENIRSLDATNLQLTEARDAMVRAEKMASVGRLGAGIAHEVGNPLGAILGYLGLIGRGLEGPKKELVTAAEREAQRIDRIVRGLLDYGKPRESHLLPMDVNRAATDAVTLLSTQGRLAGITLDVAFADDMPGVLGDPYQLQQVLVNLLVNATDALAESEALQPPRLAVSTRMRVVEAPPANPARRRDDPPGIDYTHRRRLHRVSPLTVEAIAGIGGTIVEIEIADNGPGIPDAVIDQIFEPFVTTKEPGRGTGLGLAVCARLVETMGGVVRADATPGGGATFTVVLPAMPENSEPRTQ
jgi:two-component system NtrC family sensor kinase